jgi:type IV pilus assembly protein PilM
MKINLNPKAVGLDISDRTVEAVGLRKIKEGINIIGMGRAFLPAGIIEKGRIKNKEALKKNVSAVLAQAIAASAVQPPIIFPLPAAQTFTYLFYWRSEDQGDMGAAVAESIKTTIPYPFSDLEYTYRILGRKQKKGVLILVLAIRKKVKQEWENFFNELSLPVVWFDTEILASARGIFENLPTYPTAVLDIGATTASFFVFTNYGLVYTHIISQAGDDFTKHLATQLGIDWSEAEKLKKEKGLRSARVKEILAPVVETLIKDVKKDIDFWQKENKQKVKELILIGGSSQMPGLLDFWQSKNSEQVVRFGRPWLSELDRHLVYLEAFGAAWRGLEGKWEATDPGLPAKTTVKFNFLVFLYRLPIFSFYWTKRILRFGPKIKKGRKLWLACLFGLIIFLFWLFGRLFLNTTVNQRLTDENFNLTAPAETVKEKKKKHKSQQATTTAESFKPKKKTDISTPKKTIKIKPLSARLNVRQGPGLDFKIISQAEPGENYVLLKEREEWIKIRLSSTTVGWVFAKFVEK